MYEQFFGFQREPFSLTPDPDSFYANKSHQETFATLQYGIEARKGLMLLTGEAGTGKTTLLRKLMRSLETDTSAVFAFHTHFSFPELLQLIFHDLGLPPRAKGQLAMIEDFRKHLVAQFEAGRTVALVIDEAQNMSDEGFEGIRLLSNLETEKERLLQIVLVGQPELETKLDDPDLAGLKQRIALRCRLSPLEDAEIESYISRHLQWAGYEGERLFSPEAIRKIAAYADGSPRAINIICDNALVAAYAGSRKEVGARTIDRVAADLRLAPRPESKASAVLPPEEETEDRSAFREMEHYAVVDPLPRPEFTDLREEVSKPSRERRLSPTWVGIFSAAILLGASGGALYVRQNHVYLEDMAALKAWSGSRAQTRADREEPGLGLPPDALARDPASPKPRVPAPASKSRTAGASGAAVKSTAPKPPTNTEVNPSSGRDPVAVLTEAQEARQRLRLEIIEAIRNRAITGVEVWVIDGTAYLDGRVETDAEKFAAERAARNVPGIEHVRNRIVATSFLTPRGHDVTAGS